MNNERNYSKKTLLQNPPGRHRTPHNKKKYGTSWSSNTPRTSSQTTLRENTSWHLNNMKTSPKPTTTTEGSEKLQLVIDTRQDLGKHLPYTHQDPSEPHTSFPPSEERHTERSSSRPRQGVREHSLRPSKRHTSVTTIWFSRSSQGTTQVGRDGETLGDVYVIYLYSNTGYLRTHCIL